jgi:hypothetical protein
LKKKSSVQLGGAEHEVSTTSNYQQAFKAYNDMQGNSHPDYASKNTLNLQQFKSFVQSPSLPPRIDVASRHTKVSPRVLQIGSATN